MKRILRRLFLAPGDPRLVERVICRKAASGATHTWRLEGEAFRAVRDVDHRTISVRDEVQAFLQDAFRQFQGSYFGDLLATETSTLVAVVAKLLLAQTILEIEQPDTVRVCEVFRDWRWWQGESFYVDHLVGRGSPLRARVRCRPWRAALRPLRDLGLFVQQAARSFGLLLRARSILGIRQVALPRSVAAEHGADVFWVALGTTSLPWVDDFLAAAQDRQALRRVCLADCSYYTAADHDRLGLAWSELPMPPRSRLRTFLKARGAYARALRSALQSVAQGAVGGLCRCMRRYWQARVLGSAEDALWEAAFRRLLAGGRPVLAYCMHWNKPAIAAFRRAAVAQTDVYRVYLQHGVNVCVYFPLAFDAYCVLTAEDRAYLESFGVDPRRVTMIHRIHAASVPDVARRPPSAGRNKILFLNQHADAPPMTQDYVQRYLRRIARLAEEGGWELVVRPHPVEQRRGNVGMLRAALPGVRVADTDLPLQEHLRVEAPAVVASFYSTGVLEGIRLQCLPVLFQVGLEPIRDQVNFQYEAYGIVIHSDGELDRELPRIMRDDEYRRQQTARVSEHFERTLSECVDLRTCFSRHIEGLTPAQKQRYRAAERCAGNNTLSESGEP